MNCGPSCLAMVARFYGRNYTLQTLRSKSYITRQGVSLLGISDAAESIGFRTMGAKISFEQLVHEAKLPCILHWNQNHFVVLYDIKKKKRRSGEIDYTLKIADPAGKKYPMDREGFGKCWLSSVSRQQDKGIVLLLEPAPDFYLLEDDVRQQKKNLGFYFRYLLPYKKQYAQLIVAMCVGSLLALIFPFLTQAVVDQGIANNNLGFVTLVLISQLILTLTQTGMGFLTSWITLHTNARISISVISDFLAKLMRLPIHFFDSKNIGDILQRIGDHGRIQAFLSGTTLTTLFSFFNFFIFAIILGYYNLTILGVFILGNGLYVTWVLLFMRWRRKLDYVRFTQSSVNQSNMVQMITGMQEIKLNNCEKQQRWHWERIQIKLFKISIKGTALEQYQAAGSTLLGQFTTVIISFLTARAVIEGNITLGTMMSVSYIIGQLSGPIGQVIGFAQSFQDAKISLERLNEIHNREDEEQLLENKLDRIPSAASITVKDLSFSYDGAQRDYVLKDLNVEIPRGKITALVGTSGSGKTTLVKLLLGFYEPVKGTIKIGDTHLHDINPHLWRQSTGVVMQDGYIFSDTIANNIAFGAESVDKERLRAAVKTTNITDFIESLPLKYNTKIGMEGNGVSQGQRQRMLIARAVYKDPEFLFLDEATNALDSVNERKIMENLREFYQGRTVVIVAHRLSTVQHADNILVLDDGRLVEQGTHAELVALKSAYYTLARNQLELGL
ncbi:MAG: peptidase domain-containing ABC transporter [Rikenellaceae bacterium]|nr:peptidase domain-containing ABC transporter [Rikenellaceae bacterium]